MTREREEAARREAEREKKRVMREQMLRDKQNRAALFSAVKAGDLDTVRASIQGGMKLSEREKAMGASGPSLLHCCVFTKEDGDKLGREAAEKKLSVANFLLEQDRKNVSFDISWLDSEGCTVIHR